jgi:molecular chaperone HscB
MASSTTPTLQVCRDCGGGAPIDAHFCPQCTKILSLGRHGDYFAFLGLPRKLNLDPVQLEQRFRDLSRQFHPDYFYNAPPSERRASLERSSYLNDAYRTLKNPVTRIEYLLDVEGLATGDRPGSPEREGFSRAAPPKALLEEVFALNEELDEIREQRASGAPPDRWQPRLERARAPIEAKRAEHETQLRDLSARWDALVDASASQSERRQALDALRERILERNYINNLLASIERELSA